MKQISKTIGLLSAFIVVAAAQNQQAPVSEGASGVPDAVISGQMNPLQVALLYWYPANLTTSFPMGHQPVGLAFDGANMWVTNYLDNTVTKIRTSDGYDAGQTFSVGSNPAGVAFDGANIWVANSSANNVTELRASDGTFIGSPQEFVITGH